jgi:iron complex outermembrane recepter protein
MSASHRLGRSVIMAGVASAALAGSQAWAQDLPINADDTVGTEIVVTAQKRSERLQDVAASVSVVTADDLTEQGAVRFSDYASRVPGLSLTSNRAGSTQITLRGITTGAAQPGSTTGYYVDEAPVGSVNAYTGGSNITPDLDPAALAQIEVLKGPQGTLYGAGAVGGLLKFTTATPNFDDVEGRVSAGVTSVAHGDVGYSARGLVSVPIAPGAVALSMSGFYRKDPGYIDNINPRIGDEDINEVDVRGGRVELAARLGPDVTLRLSALAQDTNSDATNLADVDAVTLRPLYGDLTANRFVRERGKAELRLYNATLKAQLGSVDLTSSTTYQTIGLAETGDSTLSFGALLSALAPALAPAGIIIPPNLGIQLNTFKKTERWSQEARAGMNDIAGMLDLQGGFYWTYETNQNRIPGFDYFSTVTGAPITTVPQFAVARIDSKYEEYSFFGNARLHITEKFDILGGIRYAHDNQDYEQDYRGLLISIVTGFKSPVLAAIGEESADVVTWLVSPRYRFSEDLMVYGRAATGYRPGGPNPAPPTGNIPLTFEPDRLTQYELGIKAQTADRALSLEAAAFHTDWNDIQIQTSSGGFNYIVNGGNARSRGAEATVRYRPVSGLQLGANVSYIDARLTTPAPAAGGVEGDRLPYVPKWSGSVSADYDFPIGVETEASFGGTISFVSDRISDYSGKFPKRLEDYATFDLRAGVTHGNLSFSAFARNLTDKRAINVVGPAASAPSNTPGQTYFASYIQPRTIGAEVAFRF